MNCCVSGIQRWVSNALLYGENLSRVESYPPPPPPPSRVDFSESLYSEKVDPFA